MIARAIVIGVALLVSAAAWGVVFAALGGVAAWVLWIGLGLSLLCAWRAR